MTPTGARHRHLCSGALHYGRAAPQYSPAKGEIGGGEVSAISGNGILKEVTKPNEGRGNEDGGPVIDSLASR